MKQKFTKVFTVFIVPHTEEATFSFRLPLWLFKAVCAFFIILLLLFIYLAFGTMNLQEAVEKNKYLQKNTRTQREEIDEMTAKTDGILDQIAKLEEFKSEAADKMDQELEASFSFLEKEQLPSQEDDFRLYRGVSRSPENNPVINRTEQNLQAINSLLPQTSEAIAELKDNVEEYSKRMAATPKVWPTRGRITSSFGNRRDPFTQVTNFHRGVDIANSHGTAIYATADGNVIFSGYKGGYGNLIVIDHGYGYETYYAHLSRIEVSEDQQVSRGDIIGRMGRTGRAIGSHLHYEVHVNGTPVDPEDYME